MTSRRIQRRRETRSAVKSMLRDMLDAQKGNDTRSVMSAQMLELGEDAAMTKKIPSTRIHHQREDETSWERLFKRGDEQQH